MSTEDLEAGIVWQEIPLRVVCLKRTQPSESRKYVLEILEGKDAMDGARWAQATPGENILQYFGAVSQKANRLQVTLNRIEEANSR